MSVKISYLEKTGAECWLYTSQKSLKAKMVGFARALPTLRNMILFQILKYLCLTMSAGVWEREKYCYRSNEGFTF